MRKLQQRSVCPAEPGTGVLQRQQLLLPDGPGQTGGAWGVSPHRHVHHAGEATAAASPQVDLGGAEAG